MWYNHKRKSMLFLGCFFMVIKQYHRRHTFSLNYSINYSRGLRRAIAKRFRSSSDTFGGERTQFAPTTNRLSSPGILRFAQDDRGERANTVCPYPHRLSNPEILRFAQDDSKDAQDDNKDARMTGNDHLKAGTGLQNLEYIFICLPFKYERWDLFERIQP